MKRYLIIILLTLTYLPSISQEIVNPVIQSTGGIYRIDDLDKKPDPGVEYKIVLDLRNGPSSPNLINPALNNIARMLNLHGEGGIDPSNIKVVGVLHALATPATQNDSMYNDKYNISNPNNELIQELTDKGVELFVCGQSLEARGFGFDHLNPNIKLSISALTILTEYASKGYTVLVF